MIDESLAFRSSLVHRLDPSARILSAGFLSFGVALSHSYPVLAVYFFCSVILVFSASLTGRETLVRLKPLLLFLIMIWIFLPLSFEGHIIWRYGWIHVSEEGIWKSVEISVKSVTIVLFFTALVATMTVAAMGQGMHRLKVPDKLVFIFLMTYRYISVMQDEYNRLWRAAVFRGFRPGTNLHSYRTFAYLAGMLFVRASCRAQRVHRAMICRGFTGRFLSLDVYRFNVIDFVFTFTTAAFAMLLFMTEYFRIVN